jgi:Cysteine-rich secretory protein family
MIMTVSRSNLFCSAIMMGLFLAQPLYIGAIADGNADMALTKLEPKLDLGEKEKALTPAVKPASEVAGTKGIDNYPTISQMEVITFGAAKPDVVIDDRLSALEQSVFKEVYKGQTLFDRTERLKVAVLGATDETGGSYSDLPLSRNLNLPGLAGLTENNGPEASFLDGIAQSPENLKVVDKEEVCRFALEVVNIVRSQMALDPLVADQVAGRMAKEHLKDLITRNVVSHNNRAGENPDFRYTTLGGTDAVSESLITLKNQQYGERKPTRALAVQVLKSMMAKEDDREALLSPDVTGFGFSLEWMEKKTGVLVCCEFSTKHGIIQPIATPIRLGEKIEVKGLVTQPYKLDRITLAWEGTSKDAPVPEDETDEALPYFPPLDYVAYASKSEHDYEKAAATLRTVGIVAAIAGGMFIPPVALAAPLIACSGGMSEPKPMSDIPVHGGVKVEGSTFSGKLPIRNSGKEGLYYVTIWASSGKNSKSVPISRRAYMVNLASAQQVQDDKTDELGRKLEVEAIEQHKS